MTTETLTDILEIRAAMGLPTKPRRPRNKRRTKRDVALDTIRVEVAQNGEVTSAAMRAYVENRISQAAFDDAVRVGMQQFRTGRVL